MNKTASDKQRLLVTKNYEQFVKSEFAVTDFSKDEWGSYISEHNKILFHMFNAGYHTHMSDTLTYGCPTLKRLFNMEHNNVGWWNE